MSNKLGFGGWQLANPLWNQMTMDEAVSLVRKAYQLGVRFFDTAPNYGDGNSEKAIGEAWKRRV
jgi:aryl-alcohol dehydrogenase-like predicted oxidoreductase